MFMFNKMKKNDLRIKTEIESRFENFKLIIKNILKINNLQNRQNWENIETNLRRLGFLKMSEIYSFFPEFLFSFKSLIKILKKSIRGTSRKLNFALKILQNEIEIKRAIFGEKCYLLIPLLFKKGKLLLQKRIYELEYEEEYYFKLTQETKERKFIDAATLYQIIGLFNDYLKNDLTKEYFDFIIGKYKIFLENLNFLRKIEKNADLTEKLESLINELSLNMAFVNKELILEKDQEILEEFILEHNYY